MTQQRSLVDAAETLAQAIINSPEWEEWRAARAAREGDPEIAEWTNQVKRLLTSRALTASSSERDASRIEEDVTTLRQRVARHPASVREQAAGGLLVELLQDANQLISGSLGIDFAGTAAPRQGGCCG
ncbi:MAG: YlbF family regulator [Vicinamibacterales bacterium]